MSDWSKLIAQAQADADRYKPDLVQVEKLLEENPTSEPLLHRRAAITWYIKSIEEGIEVMKELAKLEGGITKTTNLDSGSAD